MTILISITILASLLTLAFLVSHGLPETMRAIALHLLHRAKRMELWREERDARRCEKLAAFLED